MTAGRDRSRGRGAGAERVVALVVGLSTGLIVLGGLFTFHPGLAQEVPQGARPAEEAETAGTPANATAPPPRPHAWAPLPLAAGVGLLAGAATYALGRVTRGRLPEGP